MQELPEIPAQDFFLGLASAGLLLVALLVLARPRGGRAYGREYGRRAILFTRIPLDRQTNPLSLLGALFLHLVLLAMVPWMQVAFPDMPFDLHRYDLVLVQFKMKEAPLTMPPDIARMLKEQKEKAFDSQQDNPLAVPDLYDDPGRGNGEDAPKLEKEPGGEETAEQPKIAEEQKVEQEKQPEKPRFEIVVPERPSPKQRSLAEVAPAPEIELHLRSPTLGQTRMDLAWEFEAPDPDAIPFPGIPSLADLAVESPSLPVSPGLPTNLPDLGQQRLMTPALAELADAPSLGDLGENGFGSLLVSSGGGDVNSMLLGAALRGGAFGEFFGGSAGNGIGSGFGDGEGPGASSQGGEGYGIGKGGRSPVPRKLHGIILISNDASTIPEAPEVLTGNPIYTVYLEAPGFTKKWILQVCVPAGDTVSEVEPGVIRVLSRKSLDPPYAEHKAPLELELGGLDPRYLPPRVVVYATVSPDGELGNLRIVSGLNPETDNQILANLQEWEFNPAFRDGEPVAVEALFGIPLR